MKLTATHHQLDLNDIGEIADFIISFVKKANNETPVHAVST